MANEARIALSPLLGAPAAVAWQPVQGARIALSPLLGALRVVAAQPGQAHIALSPLLGAPRMVAQSLGDLWAYYGLPLPDVQGYGYQSAFRLQRALMASGVTRQRRLWAAGYRKLTATFTLTVDQLPVLHTFLDDHGYDWFPMSLVTGEPGEPQDVSLYVMLDRSDSMLLEAEPGVTRLRIICAALTDAIRSLEPRVASGDLKLNIHVSSQLHLTSYTRKWTGYRVSYISLADLYDWIESIAANDPQPWATSSYRSHEIEGPVPQAMLDELGSLGLPESFSTTIWGAVVAAPEFFNNFPNSERISINLSDGLFDLPSDVTEALAILTAIAGLSAYSFQVGGISRGRLNMVKLDNTPVDGVPDIAFGDYESLRAAITKALPIRNGAFVKTVRVIADPEFSNLDTATMSVSLQLEIL